MVGRYEMFGVWGLVWRGCGFGDLAMLWTVLVWLIGVSVEYLREDENTGESMISSRVNIAVYSGYSDVWTAEQEQLLFVALQLPVDTQLPSEFRLLGRG